MSRRAPDRQLVRFDAVERAVHWANAFLFGVLVLTALPLYFPGLSDVVGRRAIVAEIHLIAGIALPVPLLVALGGRWGRALRRDLRRMSLWTADEARWLRKLGRAPGVQLDKFNPGQKANAAFTGGMIVVMLGTGLVMHFIGTFPLSWRTGATFVHDVGAFALVAVITGHVGFALTHPHALWSMIRGEISERWAKVHAPRWFEEQQEPERA